MKIEVNGSTVNQVSGLATKAGSVYRLVVDAEIDGRNVDSYYIAGNNAMTNLSTGMRRKRTSGDRYVEVEAKLLVHEVKS
jgi:hypothetical protein